MTVPKPSVQLPIVVGLDLNHIQNLLFGLAYAKTIACASQVGYRYDYLFNGNPSNVTLGENFNELQFKRWVMEEYANQLGRFQKAANDLDAADLAAWIRKQWEIREKFFRTYQQTSAELDALNKRLQNLQLIGARLAATAQLAAEMALIGLGIAPKLATTAGASMVGWSALATASGKIALGVGTGIAVTVAENWATAQHADVVYLGKACTSEDAKTSGVDGLKSSIGGFVDDLIAPMVNASNNYHLPLFDRECKRLARLVKNAVGDAKKAKFQGRLDDLKSSGPGGTAATKVSKGMLALGYLFSATSCPMAASVRRGMRGGDCGTAA